MLMEGAKDSLCFSVTHYKHPKQPHTVQVTSDALLKVDNTKLLMMSSALIKDDQSGRSKLTLIRTIIKPDANQVCSSLWFC